MATTQAVRTKKAKNTLEDAMGVLFSKLDEAIDDMEQGRVISHEDFWAEFDAMDAQGE